MEIIKIKDAEAWYQDAVRVMKGLRNGPNYSPQNAGVAQLIIHASRPAFDKDTGELIEDVTYADLKSCYGEDEVITAIQRGAINHHCEMFRVIDVNYDVHSAKKEQLCQRGRASKWEWIKPKTKKEAIEIINYNKKVLL